MIGDKLIIREHHTQKAVSIYNSLSPSTLKTRCIIGIAGESGTGKSEIANELREIFYNNKVSALIISLDDYYETRPRERNWFRRQQGLEYIGPREIMWEELNKVLKVFRTGSKEELLLRQYNKFTDSLEHVIINNKSIDVVILEGLYSLYTQIDFGVYLEGTYKETKSFRIERGKEAQTDFRNVVLAKEHEAVKTSKNTASIFITMEGSLYEM